MGGRIAEDATADATTRHEDVTVDCRANNEGMPGSKEDAVTCPYDLDDDGGGIRNMAFGCRLWESSCNVLGKVY